MSDISGDIIELEVDDAWFSKCNCSDEFCEMKIPKSAVVMLMTDDPNMVIIKVKNKAGFKKFIPRAVWREYCNNQGCDPQSGERWYLDN
jgi:hypothetical protein